MWIKPTILLLATTVAAFATDPLPAERTPGGLGSWATIAGVPGGIPNRTTVFTNFASGRTIAQIQAAINNCPSNSVVTIGAGTYNGDLTITTHGVTVRGVGPTTIINGSITFGNWSVWGNMTDDPTTGNHVNWTNGLTQGSTDIKVASVSGYSVGQLIVLDQNNDTNTTAFNNDSPAGYSSYKGISVAYPGDGRDRIGFQLNRIAAISGNTITLSEPVYMPNFVAAQDPEVWRFPVTPVMRSGVESLKCNELRMHYTYSCWLTNVTPTACINDNGTVQVLWSLRGSIVGCKIQSATTCSDGYGLEMRACAAFLVENNIINNIGPALQPNSSSGCVYGYNFLTNITSASSWMSAGFLNHGSFPTMNLIEGNIAPKISWDNTDGPSGYNVTHRNWAQGIDQARSASGNIEAVTIQATNRYHSVIGNVLGTAGVTYGVYEASTNCTDGVLRIFALGMWGAECGTFDPITAATLIRVYNWDEHGDNVKSNGYAATDIPNSYYLTSKPSWFGNLAWPAVDPQLPTYSRSYTNIPSGYLAVLGTNPPSGDPDTNAPVITSGDKVGTNGTALSYTITVTGTADSFGATNLPTGLSCAVGTGIITGTPALAGATTNSVGLFATNGVYGWTNKVVTFSIAQTNPPTPVITSGNASGTNNAVFLYSITATESPTSYGATNLPTGLYVTNSTGKIGGTPLSANGQTNSVGLFATNANGYGTAVKTFSIAQSNASPVAPSDFRVMYVGTGYFGVDTNVYPLCNGLLVSDNGIHFNWASYYYTSTNCGTVGNRCSIDKLSYDATNTYWNIVNVDTSLQCTNRNATTNVLGDYYNIQSPFQKLHTISCRVPASISANPVSATIITNSTANFSVTAGGTAPLYYQWQTNSVNVADSAGRWGGATTSRLWITNATIADSNTLVRCIVTNMINSATSTVATLTVTNGTTDGPNVWYWTGAEGDSGYTDGASDTGWAPQSYSYGSIVTNVVAGTCTKLAVKCYGSSGPTLIKVSLYDAAGNRVSSSTADTVAVGASGAWKEVTLATPVAVTAATTYYVRLSAAASDVRIQYSSVNNFGVGDSIAYASFPPATLALTWEEYRYAVKMYVD